MPYNSAADSFRTKQLCSRLSQRYRAKTGIKLSLCVFAAPPGGGAKTSYPASKSPLWGDLEAGYDVDHRLIGKRVVDFLLVIIELFWTFVLSQFKRLTDGRTDRRTDRCSSERPRCIQCSAVKILRRRNRFGFGSTFLSAQCISSIGQIIKSVCVSVCQ